MGRAIVVVLCRLCADGVLAETAETGAEGAETNTSSGEALA
jgi:hypothetical protein